MKKIKYILIFMIALGMYSCEPEYVLEIDMSDVANSYLTVNNSSDVVVSESKTFNLYIRTYEPIWEDVTINWTISGDGFNSFSGTGVFRASTGAIGTYSDTVFIELPTVVLEGTALSADGILTFTCTTSSGKEIDAGYNGEDNELGITINKYIALDRSVFIGSYTESDGVDDYSGVLITEDPDDEFGLIIATQYWGDGGSYKVAFNTVAENVALAAQYIGLNYWDGPSDDDVDAGAIWYSPASDGSLGSYDTATGNFTVSMDQSLPNYPYPFGDFLMTYTKE